MVLSTFVHARRSSSSSSSRRHRHTQSKQCIRSGKRLSTSPRHPYYIMQRFMHSKHPITASIRRAGKREKSRHHHHHHRPRRHRQNQQPLLSDCATASTLSPAAQLSSAVTKTPNQPNVYLSPCLFSERKAKDTLAAAGTADDGLDGPGGRRKCQAAPYTAKRKCRDTSSIPYL